MWGQILEDAIIGRLITALIGDGYRIQASDQDGDGLYVYAMPDAAEFKGKKVNHWVKLVPGNGGYVISNYSANLEATVQPVQAFAERIGGD